MVVDTSAVIAVLLGEASAEQIDELLQSEPSPVIAAANYLELMMVAESRAGPAGGQIVTELLRRVNMQVVPVTAEHAQVALEAWRRFGKGRHSAALNFGDCFSYALAFVRSDPLLFVGDDFAQTDIEAALAG